MPKITVDITNEQAQALNRGEDITLSKKKKRREYPEEGTDIFSIFRSGEVVQEDWCASTFDELVWDNYNAFLTEEEAQAELKYRKAVNHIRRYIDDNFEYWKTDWNDSNEQKWFPKYRYRYKEWEVDYWFLTKSLLPFRYLQTEEDCDQLIKDCKDQLNIIKDYNF